ncbi:MAG: hypothetical protein ACOVLE_02005 [Pirellula staleyi]
MKQIDKVKAAKHFGLDQSMVRCRALKLALYEFASINPRMDKITRILERFRLGDAFAYYAAKPEAFGIR